MLVHKIHIYTSISIYYITYVYVCAYASYIYITHIVKIWKLSGRCSLNSKWRTKNIFLSDLLKLKVLKKETQPCGDISESLLVACLAASQVTLDLT